MRVTIKKMGINGEGIGYIDRLPVFVPGALLNEEAEIKVTERTQRYARAKVEKIIKRSEQHLNEKIDELMKTAIDTVETIWIE